MATVTTMSMTSRVRDKCAGGNPDFRCDHGDFRGWAGCYRYVISEGQDDVRAQAAEAGAVREAQTSAMHTRGIGDDGKAEAHTAATVSGYGQGQGG